MKPSKLGFGLLTGAVAFVGISGQALADAKTNPYDAIVERNPFGLKPPPPPPDPSTNTPVAPATPPAQVEVTGITSILSSKRVLLEVIPAPGKPMLKPILSEGERIESVEVVSINVEKNEVTIKNGNIVTNLTFKVAKSTGPTAPPPHTGVVQPPPIASPMPAPVQTSYNQSQGSGRYAVMMAGGNSSAPPPANPAAPSTFGGSTAFGNPGAMGANVPAAGGATDGFRQIPSRNIRTATPQATQYQDPAMSREEQYRQMEEARLRNAAITKLGGPEYPPLPPTPHTPPDAPAGLRSPPPIPGFPPAPGR